MVSIRNILVSTHECQESSVIVRAHALIRSIIGDRITHDFHPMLHLLRCVIETSKPFRTQPE